MSNRFDDTLHFLKLLRPEGPWCLTAIEPDGPIRTATFDDLGEARKFIERHNDNGENLYYSVNPIKQPINKKARKEDIAAATFLWVDCDPHKDERPDDCKLRVLNNNASLQPTFVIDSGNGIRMLWRLRESVQLDGGAIAEIEARNHAVALTYEADPSTRNVDRILRLPGTTNYPTATKIKAGRKECASKLLEHNDVDYCTNEFPPYVEQDDPKHRDEAGADAQVHDLPSGLEAMLLLQGAAGEKIGEWSTRSGLMFAFILASLKAKVPEHVIEAVCLDSKYEGGAIFEHLAEQKTPRTYLVNQIEKARKKTPSLPDKEATDKAIAELAKLDTIAYERQRMTAAKELGLRPVVLDMLVKGLRELIRANEGSAEFMTPVKVWDKPVSGNQLMEEICQVFDRYVVITEAATVACALWIVHAHAHDAATHSPNLGLTSPVMRCGKTTMLELISRFTPKPLTCSNLTPATLFRAIEAWAPTMIIDEAETMNPEQRNELRGIGILAISAAWHLCCGALGTTKCRRVLLPGPPRSRR